jgi:DNA-binding response OmpR family regulator
MPGGIQKSILVVDGDPYYCSMMVSALRCAGYRTSACSEDEALNAIKNSIFDLVLIDMGMFSMSARQLLTAIRQKDISIPVFTVGDPADKMFVINLLRNGHKDFIENYMAEAQADLNHGNI